jgi:K+-sensing histidine kinase KdpD
VTSVGGRLEAAYGAGSPGTRSGRHVREGPAGLRTGVPGSRHWTWNAISWDHRPAMPPAERVTIDPSRLLGAIRAPYRAFGLLAAVALGAAAVALKFPLDEITGGDVGYVPFVAAVAIAGWYGGFGAGVATTLVAAACNVWLFIEPTGSFAIADPSEQLKLLLFVAAGAITSFLLRSLRDRGDLLEEALAEQQRLVAERDELREQDRRASEFRDAFMDVLSHELRTPMTTIYGSAEVLARERSGLDEASRRELLRHIRDEAERLHLLIEDLLVLSRSERGRIEAASEPVEPRRVLRRVVDAEASRWPFVHFRAELADDLPVVMGEDVYVEQVTRNMLANAAKYGPPGGTVVLSAEEVDGEVEVRILDEGPGLGSVDPERLFELFYRGSVTARKASGSGIGLFVCSRLVAAMGGRIWACDRPGGGAEFGFALRLFDDEVRVEPASVVVGGPRTGDRPAADLGQAATQGLR